MSQNETEKTDIPENRKTKKSATSEEEEIQSDKTKRLQDNLLRNKYLFNFKKWPIFTLLEEEILLRTDLALIYNDGALIVTRDKMVYAIGNNKNYRLGIPERGNTLRPTKVKILCNKNLKKFAYGHYTFALTEEGEVYLWRCIGIPLLASIPNIMDCETELLTKPTKIYKLEEKRIIDIACNEKIFLVLTDDGKVYSWHLHTEPRMLSSSESKSKSDFSSDILFVQLQEEKFDGNKIICIACGSFCNIAVSDIGEIYRWSYSFHFYSCRFLQKIKELLNLVIVKVVCGYKHSLALTNEGQLYVLKHNDVTTRYFNLNIPGLQKVLDIAAVYHSERSVILGDNGYIYVWGNYFGCHIESPIVTHFSNMQEALMHCIDEYPMILFTNKLGYIAVQSDILKCSQTLFDDPLTSDFTIQMKNHSIHVHKAILRTRSQYFESMFHFKEKDQSVMVLPSSEYSYIAYKAFLKYLYTGMIDLSMQKLLKLLKLAMMLCETKLIRSCIQEIKRKITLANVVFIYNTAMEHDNEDLKKFSIQFAVDYAWSTTHIERYKKIDKNILESFKKEIANASAL